MAEQNIPIAKLAGISSLAACIQLVVIQAWSSLPEHSYNNMTWQYYYFSESGFIF